MKKVLFVGHMLRGHMLVFHLPYMQWFQERGYEVSLCSHNDTEDPNVVVPYCDHYYDLDFKRSPLHPGNLAVYRQLRRIIEENDFELIHCHTPVGGMLTRLAARKARKKGTRVIYTAHGFHFFTGAPLKNWLIFYPAEYFLAHFTDLLLTINQEDYERAQRFPARKIGYVEGVGVDMTRFEGPVDHAAVHEGLRLEPNAPVVICVGEHIPRKNHETALRAVAAISRAELLFCGVGELEGDLRALAEALGAADRVHFLGFRKDVPELLKASDAFVFPSFQEGLPVSLMEAMAAGLPCVASNVRGNADLIRPGEGGSLRAPDDVEGFTEDLRALLRSPALRASMGERNRRVVQAYSLPVVKERMAGYYEAELKEREARACRSSSL
ncbi:MAG: glycosyltransferase family 4 protein [Eubacteriales bacterium]|nr:glycosyltransferase family 4 protein [Eubacteriales bacterium]